MHSTQRRLGIALTLAGVLAALVYPLFTGALVAFVAAALSSDNQVTPKGEAQLTIVFYFGALLLVSAGLLLWASTHARVRASLTQVFFKDPLDPGGRGRLSPAWVLLVSTLAGLFLTVLMYLVRPGTPLFTFLYLEDGLFEYLTALAFGIAAFFMLRAAWAAGGDRDGRFPRRVRLLFVLAALGFFVIGMEEISWGQRIFGWSTPEAVKDTNVQDETNLHNIFNANFPLLYRLFALFPVPSCSPPGWSSKRNGSPSAGACCRTPACSAWPCSSPSWPSSGTTRS
jgi:hypothetical protein